MKKQITLSQPSPQQQQQQQQPSEIRKSHSLLRKLRNRLCLAVGILLVLCAFFHESLLRKSAECLVVSTPVQAADHLLLWGNADRQYDTAVALFRQAATPDRRVLIIESAPTRIQQLGITPTREELVQSQLSLREIPQSSLEIIEGEVASPLEACQALSRWLKAHPDETVAVLCEELRTRELFFQLTAVLGQDLDRVRIHALPDRRYDTHNWWKTRLGAREFALDWIRLVNTWCRGPASNQMGNWDPDEFERKLSQLPQQEDSPEETQPAMNWLTSLANWLDVGEPASHVDSVLVLPGDQNTRPFAAAALVRAGLAETILIPKTFQSPQELDGIEPPPHEVIQKILLMRGIPEQNLIFLPGQSDSTLNDAQRVSSFLKSNPAAHLAVVTSFYHTRRTRMVFRSLYGKTDAQFTFVSVPVDGFDRNAWWQSEVGTFQIVSEFIKLGVYWIQIGSGKYWVLAGCGVFAVFTTLLWKRRCRMRRCHRNPHPPALVELE